MGMFKEIIRAIFGTIEPTPNIDVDALLTARAEGRTDLDWRESVVDLMKLLGLDSSLENRRKLADELGYDGPKNGSAKMNSWLLEAVREKVRRGEFS